MTRIIWPGRDLRVSYRNIVGGWLLAMWTGEDWAIAHHRNEWLSFHE